MIDQEVMVIGEGCNCGDAHKWRIGTVICIDEQFGYLVHFGYFANGVTDGAWFPADSLVDATQGEIMSGLPDEDFWTLVKLVDRERVLREAMHAAIESGGES